GGQTEILMSGPGIAVDATVLAAAVRIDAGFKADIGAVVIGNDGATSVFQELRGWRGRGIIPFPTLVRRRRIIRIGFVADGLKSVGGIFRCPSAMNRHSAIIGG